MQTPILLWPRMLGTTIVFCRTVACFGMCFCPVTTFCQLETNKMRSMTWIGLTCPYPVYGVCLGDWDAVLSDTLRFLPKCWSRKCAKVLRVSLPSTLKCHLADPLCFENLLWLMLWTLGEERPNLRLSATGRERANCWPVLARWLAAILVTCACCIGYRRKRFPCIQMLCWFTGQWRMG